MPILKAQEISEDGKHKINKEENNNLDGINNLFYVFKPKSILGGKGIFQAKTKHHFNEWILLHERWRYQ